MQQFAVIGLGRFGSSVAKTLAEHGQQVLAIDIKQELVQEASEYAANAVCLDATDEKALRAVGIKEVDVAVVAIGTNLEASILVTLLLKEIGIPQIIAKAITSDQGKVLPKVGANRVIFPEREMGVKLANTLLSPKVIEQINLSPEYSVFEAIPPESFLGKSLKELEIRSRYGLNVIAIKRKVTTTVRGEVQAEEKLNVSPKAEDVIQQGDALIIIGTTQAFQKLKKEK